MFGWTFNCIKMTFSKVAALQMVAIKFSSSYCENSSSYLVYIIWRELVNLTSDSDFFKMRKNVNRGV